MGEDKITLLDSVLTDTYDLFILTLETEGFEQKFNLYMLDLDKSNPNKKGHFNK